MRGRALVGIVATLGLVAFFGLFASLFLLFSSPIPAYAQGTNNAPEFTEGATATGQLQVGQPLNHETPGNLHRGGTGN